MKEESINPILRFPEFKNDWIQFKLNELLTEHGEKNTEGLYDEVFSVSKSKGVINQIEHLGRSFSAETIDHYKLIHNWDIVYTKSPTSDFPFGIIKQNRTERTGVLSPLYGVFTPKNKWFGVIIAAYFESWVNTYNYLIPLVQKGAKNTMNINNTTFLDGKKLSFPDEIKEQQKIADFLTVVDKRIELLEKKKNLLGTYKKGVMKKIFNQEIRFKDVNGNNFPDWKKMRLGDITNKKSSNISANSIEQIEGDYIIYGATGELKKIDFYEMDRPYISIVKDGSGVGRVNMCKPFSSVLGTLDILTNNELSDLDFVFQFLSKTSFLKYVTGSSIPHIYYKDYSNLKMLVPTIEEQVKISEFLSSIDNQIQLLETQIDKSKTWKKGLLQKMFV